MGSENREAEEGETGDGRALYEAHCLVCHQADGGGVPDMQPPLLGSPIVTGPPALLIRWTLLGTPAAARQGPGLWANAMPGFSTLDDAALAAILTYVRRGFDHGERDRPLTPISPEQVAAERALL